MCKFLRLTVNGQINLGSETSVNITGLGQREINKRKVMLLNKAKSLSKNVHKQWQTAKFNFIIE